jgi:hypothetical protein
MSNVYELSLKQKSGVASQTLLQEIHRKCAEHFLHYLENTPIETQRAAKLHVIVRFLKDNGVEHASSVEALEALSRPAAELQAQTVVSLDGFEVPFQ